MLMTLLALALATVGGVNPGSAVSSEPAPPHSTSFKVLQMNLCLSGVAACYDRAAYPAVVDEAAGQVAKHQPDAVTLNEACRDDAAAIARRAGYHLRFTAVLVRGAPLPCVQPGGRGVFGLAVLTKGRIETSRDRAFGTQAGAEERRWICATTVRAVTACTAHLGTRGSTEQRQANRAQCRELRRVLAHYDERRTTVFGGDVNRREPCAPATMWARGDTKAGQKAGIQHIYGSRSLDRPATRVKPARYTDHDFFLATDQPARASTTRRSGG